MIVHKQELFEIVKIGVPAGIQNSMFSIANVIIQSSVNSFGENAMAGIAAGSNYDSYIYTCTNAFSQTTMTFTSQNVGAEKYENIGKVYGRCMALVCAVGGVLSLLGYIFRGQIVGLFSDVPEVITIGAERMQLIMPFYITCSLQDVVAGQIRGLGKSTGPMLVSLLGTCGAAFVDICIFAYEPHIDVLIYCVSAVVGCDLYCASDFVYRFKKEFNQKATVKKISRFGRN